MVYIRADANEVIGMGHVMRCLAIAEEFYRKSEEVTFLIADERAEQIITDFGFSAICLHSQWNDMESEMNAILQIIRNTQAKILLIDSYYVTKHYLEKLRQYIKLFYIDDLNAFIYPVDMLINYNIYAEKLPYKRDYQLSGIDTEFLLGCQYVPLRTEFRNMCKKRNYDLNGQITEDIDSVGKSSRKKILITSGGTDNYNVVCELLSRLKKKAWFQKTEFYVILGKFYQNEKRLWEQCSCDNNVFLYRNISNMSKYMAMCDIAITACGSTVYELCACGLPSVTYILADNQYELAKEFDVRGLMPWCGDIREDIQSCIESITDCLEILLGEDEMLKKRSMELQALVDGYGAERIAEKILSS